MTPRFCTKCGRSLDENGNCTNSICEAFPSNKDNSSAGSSSFFKKNRIYAEKGKLIVPECINPDIDEVPIRQYDIATLQSLLKGAFAEGRLQVTNKRILFRAHGNSLVGATSIQHEFSIEEIAGIEIRKEPAFNVIHTILMVFLTIFCVTTFQPLFYRLYSWGFIGSIVNLLMAAASALFFFIFKDKKVTRHVILSILFAGVSWKAVGAASLLSMKAISSLIIIAIYFLGILSVTLAPNLAIAIKTKGGAPSIEIRKKDGFFSRKNNDYTGFSQVIPGPDVDKAIKELGALIREVQLTGSYSGNAK